MPYHALLCRAGGTTSMQDRESIRHQLLNIHRLLQIGPGTVIILPHPIRADLASYPIMACGPIILDST